MRLTRSLIIAALLAPTLGFVAPWLSKATLEVAQAQEETTQTPPPVQLPSPPSSQVNLSRRTIWHRGETLRKDDDWVESTYSVGKEGRRLILAVQGRVEVQSAQVELADGQVRPLQVRRQPYGDGEYLLLDLGTPQLIQSITVSGRTPLSKAAYSVQLRN
ncbi:MAG TPA: hypothetical protein V6C65_42075 [Allocoleopsis sp.]